MKIISHNCPNCKTITDFEVLNDNTVRCTVCKKRYTKKTAATEHATINTERKNKPYIFISYKAEERPIADIFIQKLKQNNINYWIAPESIPMGESYAGSIEKSISSPDCFAVVVLLSKAASESSQIAREIERCITHKKLLLPVVLQGGLHFSDELKYFFSTCQFCDITASTDGFETELKKIADDIAARLSVAEKAKTESKEPVAPHKTSEASYAPVCEPTPIVPTPKNVATNSVYSSPAIGLKALICPACGGTDMEKKGDKLICGYCRGEWVEDKKENSFDAELRVADALRQNADFSKAANVYQSIIKDNPDGKLSAVYWGLFLCDFKVCFEKNGAGEYFPSFYRVGKYSVYENENYKQAIRYAQKDDPQATELLTELGDKIEAARAKYLDIATNTPPFDIFICFKDDSAKGGEGKQLANEIYNEFSGKYNIFFSERTLRHIRGSYNEYEPNIYYALYTARVMILICNDKNGIDGEEGKWVKNEWSRFLSIRTPSDAKVVIPVFLRGFDPYDLPDELCHTQGFKDGRCLMSDLTQSFENHFADKKSKDETKAEATKKTAHSPLSEKTSAFVPVADDKEESGASQVYGYDSSIGWSRPSANQSWLNNSKPKTEAADISSILSDISGETPTISDDFPELISFGSFPQTLVENPTLISSLQTALSHVKKSAWVPFTTEKEKNAFSYVDVCLDEKNYRAYKSGKDGTVKWFCFEPIRWYVIKRADGFSTLLAATILDFQNYSESEDGQVEKHIDYKGDKGRCYANNYKYSQIRTLLNTIFINEAFSAEQASKLAETLLDNTAKGAIGSANRYSCEETSDKVWLLSLGEATSFFEKYGIRCKILLSDYAARCLQGHLGDNYPLWLRTPYEYNSANAYVISGASSSQQGVASSAGIVPIIRIKR